MKKIGKIFSMVLLLTLLMTGCGSQKVHVEGKLEDLMSKLYEGVPEDKMPMMLESHSLTEDNLANFIGTSDIPWIEAVASEPGIGSIAHSVVLIRMKDGVTEKEIEEAKTKIKKNVNPRKWICVWVEEEDVIIKNKGDLIVVIIVREEETRKIIDQNFDNL